MINNDSIKNIIWKRYEINKQDIPLRKKRKNYIEGMLTNNGELFSLNQNIMTDEYNKRKKKIRNLNIIIIGFFMFLVFYLLLNLFYFKIKALYSMVILLHCNRIQK